MNLRFDPAARAEYVSAAERYKAEGGERGHEFAREFRTALDMILAFPRSYAADASGARKKLLRQFPYTIVYRATDETIEIIACAHNRREPGYWRDRL
jgi:toxin ParE1/3/4